MTHDVAKNRQLYRRLGNKKLYTIKSGLIHCIYLGLTDYTIQIIIVLLSLRIDFISANSAAPDEMHSAALLHVFIVCQRNCLGVSCLQRVKGTDFGCLENPSFLYHI